ncbi:ligated ion channel l-glutamate- and glycine-binding site domain-containing protein [Ditylenchus destructor]|uniref:Ligated ion channel l-glutamate- and glycine-binding site domain-containing protein n=1 Tax=Ditylenchus destructor TaxID=166010 RepID=A0AAD4MXH4_9BILA|nr:ligated ion channel l-glutamate- and glycine-binding site domain-containing protein [Ditylenchus destructor]
MDFLPAITYLFSALYLAANSASLYKIDTIIDQHFSANDRKIIHALWDSHEMPPLLELRFSNFNLSHELPNVLCQSISGGTIAVIGPIEYPWWQTTGVSSPAFSVAESYSRTLGLPIIRLPPLSGAIWENPLVQVRRLRSSSLDESIELAPSPLVIGSLLHSLVESREFTDAVILFQDDLELIQLQDFLRDSHIPGRLTTLLRRLPSEEDYGPVLKHVLTLFSSNTNTPPVPSPPSHQILKNPLPASLAVVIHADIQTSREVLIQASSLGLCQPTTQFIVTNLDTLAFLDLSSNFKLKPCNVTTFSVIDPSSSQISDLRLKLKAHGIPLQNSRISTSLALWSDAFFLLKQAFSQASQSNFHQGAFDDRNYREQKNVTLFVISKNGKRKMEKVALWKSASNSLEPINKSKVESTISEDLDGKKLRVTVYLEEPFVMLRRESKKLNLTGNARYEGYCIDLLDKIAKMRNFTYEIHEVHDKTYGVREGQRWNGMVGELMSKEADLAVASLTVTYSRSEVIDFTVPYMHLGISILFKRPLEAQPGLFTFTLPMSNDVWLAMLGAYIFASAAIWLMAQLSPYEKFIFLDHSRSIKRNMPQALPNMANNSSMGNMRQRAYSIDAAMFPSHNLRMRARRQSQPIPKIHRFTFLNSAWFTLSSLMQQGSDLSPRSASTRMAAAVWWFFALIFMSSYTANLVSAIHEILTFEYFQAAFLTTERMFTPIENADDLARQTKIKYGTLNRGSTMTFFKDSKVETYEKMWKLMESQPSLFVKSSKEGIERVKTSDYAYLMESSMLEYAIERDCELIQIGGLLDQKGYAFGLPKGSPFRKPISTTILRLQEKTVLTELKEKWWKRERGGGVCSDKKLTQSEFGARSVGGIFLILAVGIVISIAIAVVELVVETRKKAAIADTKVSHELVKEIKRNCSLKRKRARSQPTNREEMDRRLTAVIEELIDPYNDQETLFNPILFHHVMRDETKIQLSLDNSKECRNSSFYSASLFSTLNQSFATKTVDEVQQEIQSDCPENTSAGYVMPVLDVTPECDETEWYIWRQDYNNKRQPQNCMSEHQKMERIENALKEASRYAHEYTKQEEISYAALSDQDKKDLATLYHEMELEKAKIRERYFSLCEFKAYLDRKSDFDKDISNGRKYATTFTENVHLVNQALNVNWDKLRAGIPQKYFTPLCHNIGDSDLDKAIALGRQIVILCELEAKKSVGDAEVFVYPVHDINSLVEKLKAQRATLVKKN